MQWSHDARVMVNPAGEFGRMGPDGDGRWRRALARPALVAVVLGAATSIMCTGLLTPALIVGGTLCWAFVPAIQAATGLLVFRAPKGCAIGRARRLELLFLGHAPWTLWLLGLASLSLVIPPIALFPVGLSAVVPLALTARILDAFCREALHLPSASRWRRVVVHQALTWAIVLGYVQLASQLLPRIVGGLEP